MNKFFIVLMALATASISCGAEVATNEAKPNHPFSMVEIAYPKDGCSFQYSPFDFCDDRHMNAIQLAIRDKIPNFNQHYILLPIQEWRREDQAWSLVAIDTRTGIVYPVPIDAYSGRTDGNGRAVQKGKLIFNLNSNKMIIDGSLSVYRSEREGLFCFYFKDDRFAGHHTSYMGNDEPNNPAQYIECPPEP